MARARARARPSPGVVSPCFSARFTRSTLLTSELDNTIFEFNQLNRDKRVAALQALKPGEKIPPEPKPVRKKSQIPKKHGGTLEDPEEPVASGSGSQHPAPQAHPLPASANAPPPLPASANAPPPNTQAASNTQQKKDFFLESPNAKANAPANAPPPNAQVASNTQQKKNFFVDSPKAPANASPPPNAQVASTTQGRHTKDLFPS